MLQVPNVPHVSAVQTLRSPRARLTAALLASALCVLFALQPNPARAQASTSTPSSCAPADSGSPCGGAGPASQGQTASPSLGAGNPIHLATGNKHQTETDLPALPGMLGLELVRHYDSALSRPHSVQAILGRGWRLSYETRLYVIGATVQVMQADGSRIIFSRDARDPSRCASANPTQGSVKATRTAQGERFTWTWANGRQLRFDEAGQLEQILAPTGEFVSLRHDRDGRLLQVTDPQGRSLRLNYATPDQVAARGYPGVQAIDTPVGRYEYAYGSKLPEGSTASAALTLANLVQVTLPASSDGAGTTRTPSRTTRHYLYEDPRHPTLLTGIAVASGQGAQAALQRIVTWAYDERGRAILSLKGPAADPSSERVELRYVEPASPAVKKAVTEVITARGVTTYEHAVVAGEHRLLQARGPGCPSCAETDMRYGYDAQGRLAEASKLDAQGRAVTTERTQHDALGRVVRIEQLKPKAKQAKLIARYEYSGERFEPNLVARPSVIAGREHVIELTYNDAGQVTRRTERGWSPLDDNGQPSPNGSPIERTTTYSYARINLRSVLAQVDGPLTNGPTNTPADSDITRFEWDERASVITRVTQPGYLTDDLRYDAAGRVSEARNDAGHASRFAYDVAGRIVRTAQGWIDAAQPEATLLHAQVRSQTYDSQGRPIEAGRGESGTAAYRGQWRGAYDEAGHLQWLARATGGVWGRSADGDGVVHERWRSAAIEQAWSYRDDDERARASNAALPNSERFERDLQGTRVTAGNGATTRELLDDFGRVVLLDSPDSGRSVRAYDAADHLVWNRDALGHEARYEHDVQGRIARQAVSSAGGQAPSITQWRYEGRRLVEVRSDTQTERYSYDAFGQRIAKTVELRADEPLVATTRYHWDEAGQLQATRLPDGSLLQYERDGPGQVTALRRDVIATPWLRWLHPGERIASGIERDVIGLARYEAGNGVQTQWQRSRQGVLARLVHRRSTTQAEEQARLRTAFEVLMGIGQAQAAEAANETKPAAAARPGALSEPRDPSALIDHRYLWDRRGNLLFAQTNGGRNGSHASYAYDAQDRLIEAAQGDEAEAVVPTATNDATPQAISQRWRYHHDPAGNRLLAQEPDGDGKAKTDATRYLPDSNRTTDLDAAGQTQSLAGQPLEWDAIGRLVAVNDDHHHVRYAYSHRGERVSKQVSEGTATNHTRYLYDDAGQLSAEVGQGGRIGRLYIYMADLPVAVIDGDVQLAGETQTLWQQINADLQRAWQASKQTTVYLHTNHLGAPEAVTDASGALIWSARYAPYGRASIQSANGFALNLRLPGQYEDVETGLHYNRHRYYDPGQGRYLSADPLGLKGGINGFVYVAANPLRYVDPDGLVLFAFDGTGNDESNPATVSNVVRFRNLYDVAGNGDVDPYYITGPGTYDPGTGIGPTTAVGRAADSIRASTGPERITAMVDRLWREADRVDDATAIDIDVVGFSRGAAEAREFANRIAANTVNGCYTFTDRQGHVQHQRVNFRFMGLWDTVLSAHAGSYNLQVPTQFAYVAHAVALNEYRTVFPGESIMGGAATTGARIERGFLGAHSDIGGSFPNQDLAQVALVWMVDQATTAGVHMQEPNRTVIANPVIHDSSDNLMDGPPTATTGQDRSFHSMNGTSTWQRSVNTLKLTRFRGHLILEGKESADGKNQTAVPDGIQAADRRSGDGWTHAGRAVARVRNLRTKHHRLGCPGGR